MQIEILVTLAGLLVVNSRSYSRLDPRSSRQLQSYPKYDFTKSDYCYQCSRKGRETNGHSGTHIGKQGHCEKVKCVAPLDKCVRRYIFETDMVELGGCSTGSVGCSTDSGVQTCFCEGRNCNFRRLDGRRDLENERKDKEMDEMRMDAAVSAAEVARK